MVYENNVELVLMLCQLKENNKSQCDAYWPCNAGESIEFPKKEKLEKELKVTFVKEKIDSENFYERVLSLEVAFIR